MRLEIMSKFAKCYGEKKATQVIMCPSYLEKPSYLGKKFKQYKIAVKGRF